MVLGIIVEGPADAAAYTALIPRIRRDEVTVISEPCGGKSRLPQKFVGRLKRCQYKHHVNKALVIRDSDCRDPKVVEDELEHEFRRSGFNPSFPVHFYAPNCMLDAWLLADEIAVNQVAQNHQGQRKWGELHKIVRVKPFTGRLEGEKNAKTLFRRMLFQADLPPTPSVYAEVAAAASIDRIAQRCPYFQRFVERVHAC